jgi:hypothetical protein
MKKIWRTLKLFLVGLSLGMKKTEDDLLHQSGLDTTVGSSVNQQVKDKSLAKALLRGEVTQEVIDLRYRTYAVARESTHYKYFSPMLAKKKQDINDSNFVHFENSDNREVVTIQENKALIRNVNEFLETTENSKHKKPKNPHSSMKTKFNRETSLQLNVSLSKFKKSTYTEISSLKEEIKNKKTLGRKNPCKLQLHTISKHISTIFKF